MKQIRGILIPENIVKLEYFPDRGARFTRRITSLTWHPNYPSVYAVGSKFGDIVIGSVEEHGALELITKAEIEGSGPGGSITAMKFDERSMTVLYRTSIDSKVSKLDLVNPQNSLIYRDTDSYEHWFTAMDVNFNTNILAAGDNKGSVHIFDINANGRGTYRLHKSKIHWLEFSKKDPNMFVTAAVGADSKKGSMVKMWDIRKINFMSPLFQLPHLKGVNVARFNPVDGSRLLTSDQHDEIRVYQGPFWELSLTIKHHHNQFQHITPIKADWHPLHDVITIGKYPKTEFVKGEPKKSKPPTEQRTIEFFDAETGNLVGEIIPPENKIVSLNSFNPTGEFLASGMNQELVVWRPTIKLEKLEGRQTEVSGTLSGEMKNILRGRRKGKAASTREYSPVSDEDANNDDNAPKKSKRPRKTKSASASTATATTSNSTSTTTRTAGTRSSARILTISSGTVSDKKSDSKKGKGKK